MSGKRKSGDGNDRSSSPKKRRTEDGGEASTSTSTNNSTTPSVPYSSGPRAGIVEKIYMRNFMCHSSMEVPLNNRINFIIGRNGSGKSALLTALVVGLGGRANDTNRGCKLKEFIKKGCSSATVEITLKNTGDRKYKPQKYGDRIIVTRILSSGGGQSGYKIKTEKGLIVSTKREELDRIVSAFNIQVDNPVSVLNQDAARTFLSAQEPAVKFELFQRATQLDLLTKALSDSKADKQLAESIVKLRKESLGQATIEVKDLEHKFKRLQSIGDYRTRSYELENELYWAVAISEESAASELQNEVENEKAKYPDLMKLLNKEAEKEKELGNELENLHRQLNDITTRCQANEIAYGESKENGRRKREFYTTKLKEYKSLQLKTNRLKTNITHLRSEIEKIRKISGPDYALVRKKNEMEMKELEEKISNVQASTNSNKQYYSQLKGNIQMIQTQKYQLMQELLEKRTNIEQRQREIRDMKRNTNNHLTVFGGWVPKVNQKIEEAMRAGMFKKKPRGPLGAYMKLKDASWAPALESYLGPTLKYYCVDNTSDNRVLNKILEDVIGFRERKPMVITSKFFDKVHDVRRYAVRSDKYYSILNMLIINDPVVTNCVIDQTAAETVLLIPTSLEAGRVMSDKRVVPVNCSKALTKKGDVYYPDPNFRSYAGDGNTRAKFLQVSMQDAIETAEEEVHQFNIQLKQVQEQSKSVDESLKSNASKLAAVEQTIRNLVTDHTTMNRRIEEIKNLEPPDSNCILQLSEELDEFTLKLDRTRSEESELEKDCDEAKRQMEEADLTTNTLRENSKNFVEEERPVTEQIQCVKSQQKQIVSRRKAQEAQIDKVHQAITNLANELRKQQAVAEKAVSDASQICPRIETKRTPKTVEMEWNECKTYMASVESQSGSYEEISVEYSGKKSKYEQIKTHLSKLENCLKQLDKMLYTRTLQYFAIQRLIGLRLQHLFQSLMHSGRYNGSVKIDWTNKLLEVEILPNDDRGRASDPKSLSGGERSYSTIAFMMALWDAVEPPFYCLDEFDVFMDKANRRMVMDMLLAHARQKCAFQFIFLTPQDTSALHPSDDIAIYKMQDPEKVGNSQQDN